MSNEKSPNIERFAAASVKAGEWFIMDCEPPVTFLNERPIFYKNDAEYIAKRLNHILNTAPKKLDATIELFRKRSSKTEPETMNTGV